MKRLVAVLLAFLAIAPAARAATTPTIWNGAGVFVADPRNLPGPWGLADSLAASGFTWVALELHDGTHALPVDPMWVETLREHGLAVGGWGVERTRPVAEAGVATRLVARFGLDFYIANAEAPYKADLGRWIRSRQFTTTFRALAPTLPAALATYGAATGRNVLPIDYAAWRRAGFDLLPEAYYNQFREYRPDLTVAHALRAGWPLDRVHPIVGVYRRYPAARYVPLLRRAGTIGFSVFLADQARRSDYVALGRAIAAGAASAPFRAPPLSL